MKAFIFVMSLLVFTSIARAELVPVPGGQVASIVEAVKQVYQYEDCEDGLSAKILSFLNHRAYYDGSYDNDPSRYYREMPTITRDDAGAQPILVFSYVSLSQISMRQLSIVTSQDQRKLQSITFASYTKKDVNHGTIANPDEKLEWVIDDSYVCKIGSRQM